ncbi:MAG TPA: hypothetical protein VFA70_10855, partial [Dehalococcoidia bacterium]|nr:hypothetical protein [Dehalococcoidia bacterium]
SAQNPPEPVAINCFGGARGYRFNGTLALSGGSPSAQLGSLANLLSNVQFEGAYLAPNASSISIAFPGTNGSQDLELRRVNAQLYQRAAGGPWQTSTGQGPIVSTISRLDPQTLCQDSLAGIKLSGRPSTVESVGSVTTRHYTLGPADLAGSPGLLGRDEAPVTPAPGRASATPRPAPNETLDVWVDPRSGYPVQMKLVAKPAEAGGGTLTLGIDVTDVNGPDIAIASPTP